MDPNMDKIKMDLPNFWNHMERIANIIKTGGPYFKTFNDQKEFRFVAINVGSDNNHTNNTYNTDYPSSFVAPNNKKCGYINHPLIVVDNELHIGRYPIKTDDIIIMKVDQFLELFGDAFLDKFDGTESDELEIFI